MTEKYRIVCAQCGSDDVSLEATTSWDVDKQAWSIILGRQDTGFCHDCEYFAAFEQVEITPSPEQGEAQ